LPSGVVGPRDFAPFRRLASARALLVGWAARCAAPMVDMAGILAGWGRQKGLAGAPEALGTVEARDEGAEAPTPRERQSNRL
jgi:hypothetical protein